MARLEVKPGPDGEPLILLDGKDVGGLCTSLELRLTPEGLTALVKLVEIDAELGDGVCTFVCCANCGVALSRPPAGE
jgi:hypothetical protein